MRRPRRLIGPAGMGGMVGLWGVSSLIKSVQRGTISTTAASATATIAAVDVANTILVYNGMTQTQVNNNWSVGQGKVVLTDATTVTGSIYTNIGTAVWSYEVIEFLPGIVKSVQAGTITLYGTAPYTATITAVNTSKTACMFLGYTMASELTPATDRATRIELTASTTVTATYIEAPPDPQTINIASYRVVEFY